MAISNFNFLSEHDPLFFQLASAAEQVFSADPNTTLIKLRQLGEALARDLASRAGVQFGERTGQSDLLYTLSRRLGLEPSVRELFHTLRVEGNKASHEFQTKHRQALDGLKVARELAVWYHRAFGKAGAQFSPGPFVRPEDPSVGLSALQTQISELKAALHDSHQLVEQSKELAGLKEQEAQEYAALAAQMGAERKLYEELAEEHSVALSRAQEEFEARLKAAQDQRDTEQVAAQVQKVKGQTHQASSKLYLNEELTRILIDTQLIDAGWEADTTQLDYRKGARPEAGRNTAIAEWPCFNPHTKKNTRADYVLFVGHRPVATVEAKKFGNDVADDLRQAEEYSRDIQLKPVHELKAADAETPFLREWPLAEGGSETFKLPFAFSANGREFQQQLKSKSGIWFRDLRGPTNKSRPLMGWPTPADLQARLARDEAAIAQKVQVSPWGNLKLRDYQEQAVVAVEEALLRGERQALLAMATGTGKTITVIALMYRLLAANYFNRILFVVDRGVLGKQAQDAFAEVRPEGNLSFEQIYDVKELSDKRPDTKTKVQVATVQSMVKRIFSSDNPPPIGQFDCVIVDEAHRGYTLDRDMTEGEMELRDLNAYVSAYRRVLDYFDAVRIGLTATPAAHTVEIFGKPIFTYSYREAVVDGWLVDYAPPYTFETRLTQEGIHFDQGEQVTVVNLQGQSREEVLPDELDFDVDDFNRRVVNKPFNRVICDELAKNYLDPTSGEKTLIFCVDNTHADQVVDLLKAALDRYHGPQPNNVVEKIMGAPTVRDPQGLILQYKNERYPNVAVTVDLLTTGIDVLPICNLVFLRRVRSRILYEQMKGRATRRCEALDKDVFHIFDAVGLYKVLEPVDTMKPVAQQVSVSLEQIVKELNRPESYTYSGEALAEPGGQRGGNLSHAEDLHQQLIAKIQRLVRRSTRVSAFPSAREPLDLLDALLDEQASCTFSELPGKLKELGPAATGELFANQPGLFNLLADLRDGLRFDAGDLVISDHEDELVSTGRGYGTGADGRPVQAPEDYLDAFGAFIRDNVNRIAALQVVTTRPRDLTRVDLRELRLLLRQHEFSEPRLHDAWRDARNEDIAATIIGYIRQVALGSPLVPFEERVDAALKRIKAQQKWSRNQERWLDRLASQLKKTVIIDQQALDASPFKEKGGRAVVDQQLEGQLDDVLNQFSDYIWEQTA